MPNKSPSLQTSLRLPEFQTIDFASLPERLEALLTHSQQQIDVLAAQSPVTYANLMLPLEQLNAAIENLWGPVSHLHSVANSDEVRATYDMCLPKLTEFNTWFGQHEGLFAALQSLAEQDDFASFSVAQQQSIHHQLRDFRLSGVGLSADDKQSYANIKKQMAQISTDFTNHLMDATDVWQLHLTDISKLAGLPESSLTQAQQLAQQKDLDGYLLNLDFACYFAVQSFADDRDLRHELYKAYATRASDQGPHAGDYDNTDLIEQLIPLRQQMANLLGFDGYADYSMARKMAESPQQVIGFLEDLARQCQPIAREELAELQAFADQQQGPSPLQAWDVAYYSEKLRQDRYDLSQEALRPYFALPNVLTGLFAVAERLFDIQIEEVPEAVDVWHKDVKFYGIYQYGHPISYFYLDVFAREKKRGGAWMNECLAKQRLEDGRQQLPVAYLVCNFAPPTQDKPALLTHNDVVTLFHEFGHGLHHMLTAIDVAEVAGIRGVPWDAVELPSQLLENWAWQNDSLKLFARHYQTDAPLPAEWLQKMQAAKHFQSAMFMVRQLEFALFDLRLHQAQTTDAANNAQQILDAVRQQVAVVKPPSWNRFQHSFSHIFAGGYAAGYYSYMWADVLAADVFERFKQEGIFNSDTGAAYKDKLLAKGGSEDFMQLFKDFMGRVPDVSALLRAKGLPVNR